MKRWTWLLPALLVLGCGPKSAQQIADRFVDLYFVEIDQKRALDLTSGLAHQKLEEELSLVEKIRQTYEPEQAKPSIFYARKSGEVTSDHARFTYDITIRQGHDETARNALVSVEKSGERWTVANFVTREGHVLDRPTGASPPAQ